MKASILVVEDDRICGEAMCIVLREGGYRATLATDFQTALQVLETDSPVDLLLVDIVMPNGVNGLALSRMARMRRRDLKIIYVTGYDVPGADQGALGPILRKPVDSAALIDGVSRSLAS